jgi:predicted  nucleic acid-binding Zn-ribbon protein
MPRKDSIEERYSSVAKRVQQAEVDHAVAKEEMRKLLVEMEEWGIKSKDCDTALEELGEKAKKLESKLEKKLKELEDGIKAIDSQE